MSRIRRDDVIVGSASTVLPSCSHTFSQSTVGPEQAGRRLHEYKANPISLPYILNLYYFIYFTNYYNFIIIHAFASLHQTTS
jgi:hypothetical protein